MIKRALPALLLVVLIQTAFAGAWLVPKGMTWTQYTLKNSATSDRLAGTWLQNLEINWGLSSDLNLLASFDDTQLNDHSGLFTVQNRAVTSVMLGIKYRLLKGANTVSSQTRVFFPGNYDPAVQPSLGLGNAALEERLMLGSVFPWTITSSYNIPVYFNGELGIKLSDQGVCAGVPLFIGIALQPLDQWFVQVDLDSYQSIPGTGSSGDYASGILHLGGIWQVLAGNPLLKNAHSLNLLVFYGTPAFSRNTTAGQEWSGKLQYQF